MVMRGQIELKFSTGFFQENFFRERIIDFKTAMRESAQLFILWFATFSQL
jgi:hypothetical protein